MILIFARCPRYGLVTGAMHEPTLGTWKSKTSPHPRALRERQTEWDCVPREWNSVFCWRMRYQRTDKPHILEDVHVPIIAISRLLGQERFQPVKVAGQPSWPARSKSLAGVGTACKSWNGVAVRGRASNA